MRVALDAVEPVPGGAALSLTLIFDAAETMQALIVGRDITGLAAFA